MEIEHRHSLLFSKLMKISLCVVVLFHSGILFYQKRDLIKSIVYSKDNFQKSQERTVVHFVAPKKVQPIQELKKKAKTKSVQKKKVQTPPKKVTRANKAKKEVKKAAGINTLEAKLKSQIKDLILKNRYYPRMARRLGHEGVVEVKFTIGVDGRLVELSLDKESPYGTLNKGAMQTIQNIDRFPVVKELFLNNRYTITVPIEFSLE